MQSLPYRLHTPDAQTTSVVFASPHSGRDYPRDFLRTTVLDDFTIRSSEDAFVDELFAPAIEFGAPMLAARVPRAFVDLNRSADELDPALVEGVRRASHNPRITSGLGVIPRVVSNGRAIYRGKITRAEAQHRIDSCWRPYHTALQALLDITNRTFGEAILIDCHSMPHEAVDCIARAGARRPDVVIGDRFGASADNAVVDRIEAAFAGVGLHVIRNAPFAGAFVTQHYGRPSRRQHAIQIEIDRSIYMNERMIRPNSNFEPFRKLLRTVIAEVTEIGRTGELPLAAE
ncbi:N-formylglutamate amidohydrolase [Oceanicola sp. 22II-s10i]|uniref:N-formylglutamate amidohydrolase n=1 Tax=Oceanicola sp. 22II-s10i TaxID=1317116 RepID=UPI000B51FEF8|nr:N-formylglutamate amidohydrolase [Oceanicola sp. 22II-s10i]OWU86216.1 N-formylglutamate amidohydrolase [Oceanicola sp. 22II-s10i]